MCLASEPKYPPRKIERSRLTEPVCAEIEYWLQENAKRRMTGMRKQCLKKQDIHRALIEKGFTISYSSVCYYLQQNDIVYVEPNKVKARNSSVGQTTSLWLTSTSILVSVASLLFNILK